MALKSFLTLLLMGTVLTVPQTDLPAQNQSPGMEKNRRQMQKPQGAAREDMGNRIRKRMAERRAGMDQNQRKFPGQQMVGATPAPAPSVTSTTPTTMREGYTAALNAGDRGPFRTALELLEPSERPAAIAYVRSLDEAQRRSVIQSVQRSPEEKRAELFRKMIQSGKPPVTARDVMAKIGAKAADEVPEIVMNRPATDRNFDIRLAGASGEDGQLPAVEGRAPGIGSGQEKSPLADLAGKVVLLQVGSVTSPRFRAAQEPTRRLSQKWADQVVPVTVYTREAHPVGSTSPYASAEWIPQINRTEGFLLPDTKSTAEREARARQVSDKYGKVGRMVVDTMDDDLWRAYGSRSHALFVIDGEGRIQHASDPADFEGASKAIEQVVGGKSAKVVSQP